MQRGMHVAIGMHGDGPVPAQHYIMKLLVLSFSADGVPMMPDGCISCNIDQSVPVLRVTVSYSVLPTTSAAHSFLALQHA
jgi:hypothetical protein